MKVQVEVKNTNKAALSTSTTLEATVGPKDTVQSVQELIADITKTFSFPDQKLLFKGQALQSNQRLSECGITEGDVLEFLFQASEQTLIKQLSDLLGKQAISPEELSLLYSYRYGISLEDALKVLGHADGATQAFLANQKCFCVQGGCVKVGAPETVLQKSASLRPIQEEKVLGSIGVSVCVEVHVAGKSPELQSCDEDEDVYMQLEASETVARTKQIIAACEQMPFPRLQLLLAGKKLQDGLSLDEAGVKNGAVLVLVVHASEASLVAQLEELLRERTGLSTNELGLHYCQRFGTPVAQALRILGLHTNLRRFLETQCQFVISGGCVTLVNGPKLVTPLSEEEKCFSEEIYADAVEVSTPPCSQ